MTTPGQAWSKSRRARAAALQQRLTDAIKADDDTAMIALALVRALGISGGRSVARWLQEYANDLAYEQRNPAEVPATDSETPPPQSAEKDRT